MQAESLAELAAKYNDSAGRLINRIGELDIQIAAERRLSHRAELAKRRCRPQEMVRDAQQNIRDMLDRSIPSETEEATCHGYHIGRVAIRAARR